MNQYKDFVHLHVHTDYSLLDGACVIHHKDPNKIDLIKLAKQFNMKAIAITDHGVMGGAIEFYKKLKKNEINPIIGCEMYISSTTYKDKDRSKNQNHHLVLLSKNFEGYKNLCRLNSIAHLEGFYYKPRIDKEILSKYSNGLIGLSGCIQGEIQYNIMKERLEDAKKITYQYMDIFGKENFYLEIMDHGLKEQKKINKELIKLSKNIGTPIVATNDVHYLKKEHSKSHELMLCIQTNSIIPIEKRSKFLENNNHIVKNNNEKLFFIEKQNIANMEESKGIIFPSNEFYFKNGNEMSELFNEAPEAIKNTIEISEKCNIEIPMIPEVNHYPIYDNNKNNKDLLFSTLKYAFTEKEKIREECKNNLKSKYNFDYNDQESLTKKQLEIIDRLNYEIDVINNLNYSNYFLIIWDLIKYAKEHNIPVGPGRGSGTGSIVAYLLDISEIDPLEYGLIFERFLNPDRVNPPDFDIDFCEKRRNEIIEYVKCKYGKENVTQIGTYGTLKSKSLIKDIGKTLGFSFEERNKITKLINEFNSISENLENNENIIDIIKKNKYIKKIFEYSEPLEGLNRHFSIHASGVLIGNEKLSNLIPLHRGANDEIVTQYTANSCESLGLLKMDFLGLRTLTIIRDTIEIIKENRKIHINEKEILLNDKNTYNLINKGNTIAVFQLESNGMRRLCKKFGVKKIEDIITLIAIYRPGPMQFIPEFIDRKRGKINPEYDHPKIKNILKETYGIMLYQEQIMKVVQILAGFSLSRADILRRAIGKKKVEEMEEQKKKFIEGCMNVNKIDEKHATKIWDKIKLFTGYGFNKSHSTAYAMIAYRTAYLKANYPIEFMTAILNGSIDKINDIELSMKECSKMGIKILTPDINKSNTFFTVDDQSIRFGLSAIKAIGHNTAKTIIDLKIENGNYKNIIDFTERIGFKINIRAWENIIKSGAFDSFNLCRSQMVEMIPNLIKYAKKKIEDKEIGQGILFNQNNIEIDMSANIAIPEIPEYTQQDMLNDEKEILGFYISGHPWSDIIKKIEKYLSNDLNSLSNMDVCNDKIKDIKLTGGILLNLKRRKINNNLGGGELVKFNIEDDKYNNIPCVIIPKTCNDIKDNIDKLRENTPIFIRGMLKDNEDNREIMVEEIIDIYDKIK